MNNLINLYDAYVHLLETGWARSIIQAQSLGIPLDQIEQGEHLRARIARLKATYAHE